MVGVLRLRRLADHSAARLALIWAGLSFGIAFVATPAKFLAPTLTLPVALEVGRQTFRIYNGVELGLASVATVLALSSTERRRRILGFTIPIGAVLAQTLWLIPALDARTLLVQAGQPAPASHLHSVYITIEAVKILALMLAALVTAPARRPLCGHEWAATPPLEPT